MLKFNTEIALFFLNIKIIYQQQRRIVITTFNLVCLYYSSQYYNEISVNLDELSNGVFMLKELFEELGAHVATDQNCIKHEIMETVEIHSNILHFKQGRLEVTQVPPEQLAQEIDVKRLKAHCLSPRTMAIAIPSMALQLYINPCLFWLARPGYLIMAALHLEKEQETNPSHTYDELIHKLYNLANVLDNIFKHEFIIESNREKEVCWSFFTL